MPRSLACLAFAALTGLFNLAPLSALAQKAGSVFKDCSTCPQMVVVPAGKFIMGSPPKLAGGALSPPNEEEEHPVSVQAFAIGKFELTQAEWSAVMGSNPSKYRGPALPVESVKFDDVQAFLAKLSARTGKEYRLPSEAEWEYAARAGGAGVYPFGNNEFELGTHAWFYSNSGHKTHSVGGKAANKFGLFDMLGNVWEWTADCYHGNYRGAPADGAVWAGGDCARRVLRGGSHFSLSGNARPAYRFPSSTYLPSDVSGFRVARSLTP